MKAQVMTRAWEIARQAVVKFGGKVKEFFAQALRMAWAETKNTVKTITVKRWFADKKREEMGNYRLAPVFKYFNNYYVNVANDTVEFIVVDILKETEKAVQVALDCETINFRGHKPYITWFPKSTIVNM